MNTPPGPHSQARFALGYGIAIALYVHYGICLIVGTWLFFLSITSPLESLSHGQIILLSYKSSIGVSLMGSSVAYARKLYKYCLREQDLIPSDTPAKFAQLGSFVYFFSRPIFGCVFSIILVLAVSSGLITVAKEQVTVGPNFVYLTTMLAFFCGFLAGKTLELFEVGGIQFLSRIK